MREGVLVKPYEGLFFSEEGGLFKTSVRQHTCASTYRTLISLSAR